MNSAKKDYWIYGKHAVLAALANPKRKIFEVMIADTLYKEYAALIPKPMLPLVNRVDKQRFKQLFFDTNHQFIALRTLPLNPLPLNDILQGKQQALILILDQINDPHNLGAIIRSAAAFAADAIIIPKDNASTESAAVCKVASGAFEHIPLVSVTNIVDTISKLKQQGFWVAGLDGKGNSTFADLQKVEKICLILGSEEGLRRLTKTNCDFIISINISPQVESLNMSNAAAIALYEASKIT